MRQIELRSDTFTLPTPGMMEAMFTARVGDDVFEEDNPTRKLEEIVAKYFGFESGLFCVSGTMANQIAINCHVRQGDEVICDKLSHIYLYEGGGIAANSSASVRLLDGDRGRIAAWQIEEVIQPDNVHYPISRLVSLENTVNKGGGAIYDPGQVGKIERLCKERGLALHLDGARLMNALVETREDPRHYSRSFDSVSICLSKGLGAPMGSVLLGSYTFIHQARRVRKRLGGGWRQSGFMAAAGLFAFENQAERLKEDHLRAKELGSFLQRKAIVENVLPVNTNIVIFSLSRSVEAQSFVKKLASMGIKAAPFGLHQVRLVTHLNFTDDDLEAFFRQWPD